MPIQLNEENGGKVFAIHVSSKLIKDDYADFVLAFERLVRQQGKLRLLFDMSGFHSWIAAALWENVKFAIKYFVGLDRLAMVREQRWQHDIATYCKPYTKATIRYFDHDDVVETRMWLSEA